MSGVGVTCRKRYIDDQFVRALEDGIGNAVVLSAGLDTRADRLGVPAGATVFEVDLSANIEHKRRRLPVEDRVILVPVVFDTEDLRATLTAHGYHPGAWWWGRG